MCKRELGGKLLDEHMRLWRPERNSGGRSVYAGVIHHYTRHISLTFAY
jgi:hypothetical protein